MKIEYVYQRKGDYGYHGKHYTFNTMVFGHLDLSIAYYVAEIV